MNLFNKKGLGISIRVTIRNKENNLRVMAYMSSCKHKWPNSVEDIFGFSLLPLDVDDGVHHV